MKKLVYISLLILFPVLSYAQVVKQNEKFTGVTTFNDKVVFIKEIQLESNNWEKNYQSLKQWAKTNYAKDHFNSSVHYDDKKKSIHAQSRVELLLPQNSKGVKEKLYMKYRINAFIKENMCIVEIVQVSYINDRKQNNNTLEQKIKAERMITPEAIAIQDENTITRKNTLENTLYFINDLVTSLENVLNPA